VVAGTRGFAQYSTVSRKWRLFGNQGQEQAFSCTKGLAWWRNYIVAACRVVENGSEEIRFYPQEKNLEIRNVACRSFVSRSIVLLNVFADYLIITTVGCGPSARRLDLRECWGVMSLDVGRLISMDVGGLISLDAGV
jgi:hypothetical protein